MSFVVVLYVVALALLFLGGTELFQRAQFAFDGENGVMKSSDAALLRAAKYTPNDSTRADVVYVTPTGHVPVHGKFLTAEFVQRLARGEEIPLRFLKGNPQRVLYEGAELPAGIGWFIGGCLALAVALYAHRLLRRESGLE